MYGHELFHPKFTHAWTQFSPSLKHCVLKYLQVGVHTKPPFWTQLNPKELNPCDLQKG